MGIVSIILGVLGILLSWIPCLWPIVAIHVVIGLGLGIADLVVKKQAVAGGPPGDEPVRGRRASRMPRLVRLLHRAPPLTLLAGPGHFA